MTIKTRGAKQVRQRIEKIGKQSVISGRAGVWAGALIVEGEAKRRVPVEHGFLRASGATTITSGESAKKFSVRVGFSAKYAAFVHENLEAKWKGRPRKSGKGVYWGPAGEPRYLYNAVVAKLADYKATVAAYMRRAVK